MSLSQSTAVVIADRHPVVLAGLEALLATRPGFHVVAACLNGLEAVKKIRDLRPPLACIGMTMPGLSGIQVLTAVKASGTGTKIIFLTGYASDSEIAEAIACGAWGIFRKDSAADHLFICLEAMARGERQMPFRISERPQGLEARPNIVLQKENLSLTCREREITTLVIEGFSNKLIARMTNISEGTVKIHLYNIFKKLGVNNRTSLASYFYRLVSTDVSETTPATVRDVSLDTHIRPC